MQVNKREVLGRKIAIASMLVNAQYRLEVNEKNIIYLALAGVNQFEGIEVGGEYKVNLNDFAMLRGTKDSFGNVTPIRKDSAKLELNKALKDLYDRSIKFGTGEEHRWITGYKDTTRTNDNSVILKWNPDLIPHLAKLKEFANILASTLVGIKGKYTNRIYELVSQAKSNGRTKGTVYVDLDEFLFMIEAGETYQEYKYLKKFVLLPSIKELEKLNVVSITLREKKVSRKVIGFHLDWQF